MPCRGEKGPETTAKPHILVGHVFIRGGCTGLCGNEKGFGDNIADTDGGAFAAPLFSRTARRAGRLSGFSADTRADCVARGAARGHATPFGVQQKRSRPW